MNHELEKEIVKGQVADYALGNAQLHGVTQAELATILRDIATQLETQ